MDDITLTFVEIEPAGPVPAGDVGGDYQSTEAYSRRFAAPLADGTYAVITISVFGELYDEDQRELRKPAGPYVLTSQTEYAIMISSDLSDPRIEEILSCLEYGNVGVVDQPATDDAARAACAALSVPSAWPARLAWQLPAGPLGTSGNDEPRTTDQYVTVAYSDERDAYRVEVCTFGDPTPDEIIDIAGDATEHVARTLASRVANERGLPRREHTGDVIVACLPGTSGNEDQPRTDADIARDEQSREHAAEQSREHAADI